MSITRIIVPLVIILGLILTINLLGVFEAVPSAPTPNPSLGSAPSPVLDSSPTPSHEPVPDSDTQSPSAPTNPPDKDVDKSILNFSTYTNHDGGYSISHPSNWIIHVNKIHPS